MSDDNAQTWLRLGRLQLESDPKSALESLNRAGALLSDTDPAWGVLARAYQMLSLPSLALRAATKASGDKATGDRASGNKASGDKASGDKVATWALESRSRYGTKVGVAEELEGQYFVALKDALKLVYKNDFKAARTAALSLHQSFPKSIAKDLIDCEIAVRSRKYSAARRSCQAVLQGQSDNAWARYLLGIVHLRAKREAQAIVLLNEAIDKDPGLKASYEALAKVYRSRSDPRLAPLRVQYQQRFGADL